MRIQRLTFFQRLLVNLTLPTSPSPERRNQPLRELGPAQNTFVAGARAATACGA
jgi:hypothetical protein